MVPSDKTSLRVEHIKTQDGLNALQDNWTELIEDIPDSTIFLTWEWISEWWRHYHHDGELWLLTVWDENDRLIGVLPWMLIKKNVPLSLRRLVFIFYRPPVHMDILARFADRERVCKALVVYLIQRKQDWDLIDLRGLAENSPLMQQLSEADGRFQERIGLLCTYISLPKSWQIFEKEHLSANRRQQVRRFVRRLEKDYPGQVCYRQVTAKNEIIPALETLIDLNREKWHLRESRSTFDDPRFRDFHKNIATLAFERGWLRMYQLLVREQVISARYCFFFHGAMTDYQLAFDLGWSSYHPGELLLAHVLKKAMKEGAAEFDFLPGEYRWKISWSNQARQEKHIVYSPKWRSYGPFLLSDVIDSAQLTGRRMLSADTRLRLNSMISRMKHKLTRSSLKVG